MSLLHTLVSFLVALTLLIFVHEFGHYIVARWCGVKVLRFSIGFGKPLLTWSVGRDRTQWTLAAIPLGGYVKMLDEREQADGAIAPADLPRAFTRQSLGRRSLIVLAGPVANFLLAIALYLLLGLTGVQEPAAVLGTPAGGTPAAAAGFELGDRIQGIDGAEVRSWYEVRLRMVDGLIERRPIVFDVLRQGARVALRVDVAAAGPVDLEKDFLLALGLELAPGKVGIANVLPGGAAERAGLRAGDEVVATDGLPVGNASRFIDTIRSHPGTPMRLELRRGPDVLLMEVVPDSLASERPADAGRLVGRINAGIQNRVEMVEVRYTGMEAARRAVQQTWEMSLFSLRMLGKMATGELSWRNLSGPVSIADYAGQSARVGWIAYVSFLALISISLGVLNLLPIPVLDGGHLVYYGLEALRGQPLSERFMEITQKAGLAVIVMMMALALFNDLSRLIGT